MLLLFTLAGATLSVAAESGRPPAQTPEALKASRSSLDLQTELPGEKETPAALNASRRSLDLQTELPGEKKIKPQKPASPGRPLIISVETARYMLWVALIVALLVIALIIYKNWQAGSSSRHFVPEEDPAEAGRAVKRMEQAQAEADDLAALGSFAEAMHALLLQAVSELRRRLDLPIAASLTSREILRRLELSAEERSGFADIVSRVEISYFGAHQPGLEEYQACRRSYELLRRALRRGAA